MGEVVELARRKARCPECGSESRVPILWGLPAIEAFEAEARGEVHLGGCTPGDDNWFCRDCETSWPSRKRRSRRGAASKGSLHVPPIPRA